MNKENKNEVLEKMLKDKKELKGTVSVLTNAVIDGQSTKCIGIKSEGDNPLTVIIEIEDLFLPKTGTSLRNLLKTEINFVLKGISEDGTLIGTRIPILEKERKDLVTKMQKSPEKVYKATVKKLLDHGAYLTIGNSDVFMYNSAYADGYIPIHAKEEVGNELQVLFKEYREATDMIYVQMKDRVSEAMTTQTEDIKEGDMMKGQIRTKTPTLCFINVAPMIDVLCSPVEGFEVGDDAFVRIVGFKTENGKNKVRGKIVITKYDDNFKL